MLNKYVPFFLVFILLAWSISQTYVPLDTKPKDLKSAKSLTRTIANLSDCSGLEYEYYDENIAILSSSCDKNNLRGGPYTDASYGIIVFSNKKGKRITRDKLMSRQEMLEYRHKLRQEMYKEGPFYIIVEHMHFGESKYDSPRRQSPHAYADFPGEMIYTIKNSH